MPLRRVESVDVEADELCLAEQAVRTGREIRQPAAHREHEIRVARELVGGGRTRHPDGAELKRMGPGERALSRLRLPNPAAVRLCEAAASVRARPGPRPP